MPGATWHLDEVFLRINGVLHYLWRAVDQHGAVLEVPVLVRRETDRGPETGPPDGRAPGLHEQPFRAALAANSWGVRCPRAL